MPNKGFTRKGSFLGLGYVLPRNTFNLIPFSSPHAHLLSFFFCPTNIVNVEFWFQGETAEKKAEL